MTDRPTEVNLRDADQYEADPRADGEASLVAHREELRVRTEQVARGRVVLRKRVVEEEQTITVTVRREELEVLTEDATDLGAGPLGQRGGGDGGLRSDRAEDQVHGRDAGLGEARADDEEMVLYAERPVVTMEVVPVERVVLRRSVTTEERTVGSDVSREEIVVEGDGLDGGDRVDT